MSSNRRNQKGPEDTGPDQRREHRRGFWDLGVHPAQLTAQARHRARWRRVLANLLPRFRHQEPLVPGATRQN